MTNSPCLTNEQLVACMAGGADTKTVERHMAECEKCRQRRAALGYIIEVVLGALLAPERRSA